LASKSKVAPVPMKMYSGSGGIAPITLNSGARWRWRVNFTPRPLYIWRNSPWYSLDRKLGGPHGRSGGDCGERNSQSL